MNQHVFPPPPTCCRGRASSQEPSSHCSVKENFSKLAGKGPTGLSLTWYVSIVYWHSGQHQLRNWEVAAAAPRIESLQGWGWDRTRQG